MWTCAPVSSASRRSRATITSSAAAEPQGYPDEIDQTFGLTVEDEVTAVENGQADWVFDPLPADRLGEIGTKYASHAHVNTLTAMFYAPMNVNIAPFNNVAKPSLHITQNTDGSSAKISFYFSWQNPIDFLAVLNCSADVIVNGHVKNTAEDGIFTGGTATVKLRTELNVFVGPLTISFQQGQKANIDTITAEGGGIWFHVDHGGPTHGCVSLSRPHMRALLRALDPALHPVVVMGDAASLAH